MNFSWNLSVISGGLPPYRTVLLVLGAVWTFNSTHGLGNVTITTPGTYYVDLFVEDSTCTQVAGAFFSIMAWGALGPNPFDVTSSANATSIPGNVTYTANNSSLPANWTIRWTTPGLGANGSQIQHTYYLPGVYNATACYVEPNANIYSCATSPYVLVNGTSPISTAVTVPAGQNPANVTFYANVTNTSMLPVNTSIYLYAWNGSWGVWAQTNNSTLSLNETVGCGFPWTSVVPVSLNCTWAAIVSLIGPIAGVDHGFLGSTYIFAQVYASGNISYWFPSATFSAGPFNGSVPLNVTLNLSAAGGVSPYRYDYYLFGRSGPNSSSSRFTPLVGGQSVWNGSLVSLKFTLNHTGVYWLGAFIADAANSFIDYSTPLIYVGNVSHYHPAPPLIVKWTETRSTAAGPGDSVSFVATIVGGTAPFEVQWAFGDGTYGSSLTGAPLTHTYTRTGTFQPFLRVMDARGVAVWAPLTPLSVAQVSHPGGTTPPATLSSTHGGGAWATVSALLGATVVAGALITLGAVVYRREIRRQGEALVAEVKPGGETADPSLGPRR